MKFIELSRRHYSKYPEEYTDEKIMLNIDCIISYHTYDMDARNAIIRYSPDTSSFFSGGTGCMEVDETVDQITAKINALSE